MTRRPISRRQAIAVGGLGIAAVATGTIGCVTTGTPNGSDQAGETGGQLAGPPMLASTGGRQQVELTAAPGVQLAGRDTRALGFNGVSPGPTLRVRPGDELTVR